MSVRGQNIEVGTYRLCYDMYWRCHFMNILELRSVSTYEFIYLDDTQRKTTNGTWKTEPNFMVLTPSVIPDTIKILDVFERENKLNKESTERNGRSKKLKKRVSADMNDATVNENLIEICEWFTGIGNLDVSLSQNGFNTVYRTDSIGKIYYTGQVPDSISFFIKDRKLTIQLQNKEIPSSVFIRIDSNHKDLVYQQLATNKIMIRDDKMFIKYKYGEDGVLKTEYFEKIK
jgi:hypothetical protein